MKLTPPTRTVARWAAGLLVAAGLVLGLGTQPAAAELLAYPEVLPQPTELSLRLEPPDAYVTFKDNAATETHYRVIVCLRDDPNSCLVDWVPGVPGEGRVATRSVSNSGFIVPGRAYCARIVAELYEEDRGPGYVPDGESATSRAACVDPASPPPDLALEKIGGREEREWAVVASQTPAYLVNLRNDGADANGTVVVDIATSGRATLAEQPAVVRQGWEAGGFTCVSRPPTGGETAGLRCTGGSLKQGERTNPAIAVGFTGPGYGYIHASVSVSGEVAETDTSDNLTTLGIRIY